MEYEFLLRRAKKEEAETIYQGILEVYEQLENKDVFVYDDLDWVKAHMEEQGFAVVACDSAGKIAASLIVRYPGEAEDNLGRDIGLESAELFRVVHMETAVVLPEYRGHHLERKLIQYAEELLDTRKYRHLLATVSPVNPASYKSVEACGYRVMVTKEKYVGLMRRVYYKESGGL